MCGIVGIYSRSDAPPPHRDLWPAMVNHLQHRGPDGGAYWADGRYFFGHRRLAIIDIDGGEQPMATADGQLVVCFNGEIYNYVELRAQLERLGHRFRTASDTEVLLHGYRAWGTSLPERLIGMFAFAVADRRAQTLLLARDRFGEKPLFVLRQRDYVAFASELRPLCALPDLDRTIDVEALGGYLSLNYVPGEATMIRAIRRLEPGRRLLLTPERERSDRYWRPPVDPRPLDGDDRSDDGTLAAFRQRFDRSVALCLRSDVPVGVLLSGGMDSSLVAEAAARQGRLDRAYFIDFAESSHSERPAAEAVSRRLGLPLQTVTLDESALQRSIDLVQHADDPLADSSALAFWTVSRLAARHNKVVLGGDGGDEIFAGYLTYAASRIHRWLLSPLPRSLRRAAARIGGWIPTTEGKVTLSYKAWRFLRAADLPVHLAHLSFNGTWLPAEAAALVSATSAPAVRRALAKAAARHRLGERCRLIDLQRNDVAEYLPNDILAKVDRMSMAHGLEVRAPFLDHRLAAWGLALPDRHKVGLGGRGLKRLLRRAARQAFGAAIADRPKQGFSIPIHRWLRGPFAQVLRDLLSPESLARLPLLDAAAVGRALDLHLAGRRSYGFELWGLAVLMAWHRCRVEHPPPPPSGLDQLRQLSSG